MQRHLAEALGTFVLVFAGTGAIVINDVAGGAITHVGIALTFGMVVMAMIHTFGDVSGAHFNPAVTIAMAAARRFPLAGVPGFVAAQCAGALAASLALRAAFPDHPHLGATRPSGSVPAVFAFEVILTAILVLTIFRVTMGAREKAITAPLAIGTVVGLEALFAGPFTGASMNPARSLAPAVVSGSLEHLWLYLAATILGGLVAIPLARATTPPDSAA